MKLAQFDFTLPSHLIAQYPLPQRSESRLLHCDREHSVIKHQQFTDLLDYLQPHDLLVLNNSKVISARLYGQKATGGNIEVLVERIMTGQQALAHVRASRAPKVGARLTLEQQLTVEVVARQQDLFVLRLLADEPWLPLLQQHGRIPLPTYMQRQQETMDEDRYQTVYAKHHGSVAAPTAGLHFDEPLLQQIQDKGVTVAYVTLHVGAGTFQPVRVEDITQHQMHHEYLEVPDHVVQAVKTTKAKGGRVVAVGTTTVRSLETAAQQGELQPYQGESNLFIYPGYDFRVVDSLVTNFHLPKSSLLMLVSAFASLEFIKQAYQMAIEEGYRFFSYGDAMLIS